ncbi:hypothetical protein IW262DRAFT_1457686 [Armillaria fumosa]|nr:hypothetical protein IW262DRAFT_1457686 [Armillaria fumosa]
MAFKSGNAQGTKVHNLMAQALGSALEAPGSGTAILQAPTPVSDQPVDIERGKYLVWELCKLNFRQELLSLDTHLTHPDSSAKEEDVINFWLKRQEQIMGLFVRANVHVTRSRIIDKLSRVRTITYTIPRMTQGGE